VPGGVEQSRLASFSASSGRRTIQRRFAALLDVVEQDLASLRDSDGTI
jgi:hypothetical protein